MAPGRSLSMRPASQNPELPEVVVGVRGPPLKIESFLKSLSEKNTSSRQMMKGNHRCGSKPFVRYREELIDPETPEVPGRVEMYHHTRFSKKKSCWGSPEDEQNYNVMTTLQSTPTLADSTPLTEDQVYDKGFGVRRGYVHGLGHGQDPLPASSLSELDDAEVHKNAGEAERRAQEAERRAPEAQLCYEESERHREECERQTDSKFNALQAQMSQMLSFMTQFQGGMGQFQMDLLMG